MPNYLQINIPQGCSENWNAMLPNNQGKHCLNCQKTVVDFTIMTDTELVNFFTKHKGHTCGRFSKDQLQRDILIPKKKVNWMKYFFHFAIPAFLLSLKASAKTTTSRIEKIEIFSTKNGGVNDTSVKKIISGRITDEKGVPIPYVSIVIKGTTIGVAADINGCFSLSGVEEKNVLIISSIGFKNLEQKVRKETFINASLQYEELVGFVGIVVTSKKKKKKRDPQIEKVDTAITSAFKLFPNPIPSSGILNISWTNPEAGEYSIQITNLQGQIVQIEKIEVNKKQSISTVALKNIPAGNYAVIVTNTKTGKHFSNQLIVL